MAGHAHHGGHVHPETVRAGVAGCHVGGRVVGAGLAGQGVGAERAGVVVEVPEVCGTGGANGGARAGGTSGNAGGASSILLEPSGHTCGAASVAAVGTGGAPGVVTKEAGVAGRKKVRANAGGTASVSIAGKARVVADDTLIVDASVGGDELVAVSTLEAPVGDLAEEAGIDCTGHAVAEVEVGVGYGTGSAEVVGGT